MPKKIENTNNDVTLLRINGLAGHMLRLPSKTSRRELLLVYDMHMDIEAVRAFAKKLTRYGSVTVADMPGFGGMDSFYRIRRKPSIDNYAAYLASFIKLRFRTKRIIIVGIGVGGSIAVRALQKYPDVASKTNAVLLLGSLVERTDRNMSRGMRSLAKLGYRLLLLRPVSFVGSTVIMRGPFLRVALGLSNIQAAPMAKNEVTEEDRLWRHEDLRTHLYLQKELLAQTIPAGQLRVPAFAVAINTPKDFDYTAWHEHLKVIFQDVEVVHSRRKVFVRPAMLFEQLTPDAKKFLRQ